MKNELNTDDQIEDPKKRAALRKFGKGFGIGAGVVVMTALDGRMHTAAASSTAVCTNPNPANPKKCDGF